MKNTNEGLWVVERRLEGTYTLKLWDVQETIGIEGTLLDADNALLYLADNCPKFVVVDESITLEPDQLPSGIDPMDWQRVSRYFIERTRQTHPTLPIIASLRKDTPSELYKNATACVVRDDRDHSERIIASLDRLL